METREAPCVKYFIQFKRVEPKNLSHSAIDTYKKCPRMYFYSWVLGYKPNNGNPIFAFGRAYHKFREVLAKLHIANGRNTQDPSLFPLALVDAVRLWQKEKPPAPAANDYKAKKWAFLDEGRLIEACKTAYEFWKNDAHLLQSQQIEQPFSIRIRDDEESSGRWDDIIKWNGYLWVRDHKTSTKKKEYFDRSLEPNDQADRYLTGLHQTTNAPIKGVIFEVMYHDGTHKPTMFRSQTSRTEGQLMRWMREQNAWLDMLKYARENDAYPMNETACTFCDYHYVCKQMNENMMTSALKGPLYKFQPYDNMAET